MLKFGKLSFLCTFVIIGCFQNKFENKSLIKVTEKPVDYAHTMRAFELIEAFDLRTLSELIEIHEAVLCSSWLNKEGETMLAMACKLGFIEAVEIMLQIKKFRETINKKGKEGCTPLMLAVMLLPGRNEKAGYNVSYIKKFNLIRLLLDNGALLDLRCEHGYTALQYALYVYNTSEDGYKAKWYAEEVIKLFKERGAIPSLLAIKQEVISKEKKEDLFKSIIYKFKLKHKLDSADTNIILMDAIEKLDLGKVEILLNLFKADQNVQRKDDGNTAMHIACIKFANLNAEDFSKIILKIIKQLYKGRNINGRWIWGKLDIENKAGDTPIGIYFSRLVYLADERRRIENGIHEGLVSKEYGLISETSSLPAICTFLSMLNHEKDMFILLKIKRITKEHPAVVAATTGSPPVFVNPTYPGSVFVDVGGQFIHMNVTKAELGRFFSRILDGGEIRHIGEADCPYCEVIKRMKTLDILIEMAY